MKVSGRSFSVVGMGKSGLAAARVLAALGGKVLLSDGADTPALREAAAGLGPEIECRFGGEQIRLGDIAVLSPGIPPSAPIFRQAYKVAGEVMGEIELFYRLFDGPIVAITGTDGKSTVTTLIAHLLQAGGLNAVAAGNLGNPLCELLDDDSPSDGDSAKIAVAEVSCFQLITTSRFRPVVALATNLAHDHLDYHGSFEAYVAAKALVAAHQAAGDTFIRNLDDPILATWMNQDSKDCRRVPGNGQLVLDISQKQAVENGVFAKDGTFYLAQNGHATKLCKRSELAIPGAHNTENALLAIAAALAMDVPKEAIIEGLATYRGLPHRIEYTGSLGGVRFYNDSKATNPHAAITGMAAFDEKVVLIAGGFEKGLDLTEMGETIAQKCKSVVLTGATTKRMSKEFEGKAPIYCESTMELATKKALELAKPSGIVLLSPGASSFDNYTGFEQRGNHFKTIVRDLMNAADIASRSC